ncbi:hypothetical protein [Sphingomonas faeni]|uniref:hypothetical protein n=1 Tax=Sphingomonas faeni TaxID=185950 RepID=UPI0024132F0F|nr:hypothetical protein [Sphingomonas faeni]
MAIHEPEIRLTGDDKDLLRLLAELILSSHDDRISSNYPTNSTVLSDNEARQLVLLLENFVSSKKFVEGSYLIEHVFNRDVDDHALRSLYLAWKKRHGRSGALATAQWQALLARLGVQPMTEFNHPWHRQPVKPMSFEHFLRMEKRLNAASGINPRVQQIILGFVEKQESYVESLRSGKTELAKDQILNLPKRLLNHIKQTNAMQTAINPISTQQIIGIAVIVMDFATLFTTRDWDASGFISTVSGAAPTVILPSK